MNKNGVVLASHGFFAKEALGSAEMILGEVSKERTEVISMSHDADMDSMVLEIETKVNKLLSTNEKVIILTDLIGGTPNNAALSSLLNNDDVELIAGLNLALLLELFSSWDNRLDIASLVTVGKDSLLDVRTKLQ